MSYLMASKHRRRQPPQVKKDLNNDLLILLQDQASECERIATSIIDNPEFAKRNEKQLKELICTYQTMITELNSEVNFDNYSVFFTPQYYKNAYRLRIAVFEHALGNTNAAKISIHCSFTDTVLHPNLIQSFLFLYAHGLIDIKKPAYFFYLSKLVDSLLEGPIGNSEQRKSISNHYEQLGYTDGLRLGEALIEEYLAKEQYDKVESLIKNIRRKSVMISDDLLVLYHRHYIENNNAEALQTLLTNYSLKVPYLLALATFAEENNHLVFASLYLKKAIQSGSESAELDLAYLWIYYESSPSDKQDALDLIKQLQTRKKASAFVRSHCAFLLGRIHDLGLLPHSAYPQSDTLAFQRYVEALRILPTNYRAMQDLAIMYKSGQGVAQNLTKAYELLSQIPEPEAEVFGALTSIKQMQIALASNMEERRDCISEALSWVEKYISALAVDSDDLRHAFGMKALLLLAQDLPISPAVQNNKIETYHRWNDIVGCKAHSCLRRDDVLEYLLLANQGTSGNVNYLLGGLFHHGNYFEQHLGKAEIHYKAYEKEIGAPIPELLDVYLEQVYKVQGLHRETYVLKALNQCRRLAKNNNTEDKNSEYQALYIDLIQAVRVENRQLVPQFFCKFSQTSVALKDKKEESYERQLVRRLEEAFDVFKDNDCLSENGEAKLLSAFGKVTFILKRTQSQLPSYKKLLPKLIDLENQLSRQFKHLSSKTRLELLQNLSYWPLMREKHGAIANMCAAIDPSSLSFSERIRLCLNLSRLKHPGGLFEKEIERLFPTDKLPGVLFSRVSDVAQLLYFFSMFHANCSDVTNNRLIASIGNHLPSLLPFLTEHCWDVDAWSLNELNFAICYLRHHYSCFQPMPEELEKFLAFNGKLISSSFTVSFSQNQMHECVQQIHPDAEQEQLLCGHSVDTYIRKLNLVIEYHGPSHFIVNRYGAPSGLKSGSVLTLKTLETNHTVCIISYTDWMAEKTFEGKMALLERNIANPSINPTIEQARRALPKDSFFKEKAAPREKALPQPQVSPSRASPFWYGQNVAHRPPSSDSQETPSIIAECT